MYFILSRRCFISASLTADQYVTLRKYTIWPGLIFLFFSKNRNFFHRQLNLIRNIYEWNTYRIILKPYTFSGKHSHLSWPKFSALSDLSMIPLNFCSNFWALVITSLWWEIIIKELFETKLSDFGDWNEMFCYIISYQILWNFLDNTFL